MLPNTTLWGDAMPGGTDGETSDTGIDTTQVIDEVLPSLHADSRATLNFWTEAQLIQWMDECLKRLSRVACVFTGRKASTLSVPGQAKYDLPPQHVATMHVSYGTTPLRPAGTLELSARDEAYQTTAAAPPEIPDHWYQDTIGLEVIGLCKVPGDAQNLAVIYEGWPTELDAGKQNTLVAAPAPLKGYIAMYVLKEAYGTEGESEMPDVAQHCAERVKMYEQIFEKYYGKGL